MKNSFSLGFVVGSEDFEKNFRDRTALVKTTPTNPQEAIRHLNKIVQQKFDPNIEIVMQRRRRPERRRRR